MRAVIYDRAAAGLSLAWWVGSGLYRALGRVGATHGAASWPEALDFLVQSREPIEEVQLWAHGKWGDARIGETVLSERSLLRGSDLFQPLGQLRSLLAPNALFWFRTCETFGADRGLSFARAFSDFMGCRAAGHTYVIAVWQSGLHALAPGASPSWDPAEGLREGTPRAPLRALHSTPTAPNTITCFEGSIPEACWVSEAHST